MFCRKPVAFATSVIAMLSMLVGCGSPADIPITAQAVSVVERPVAVEPEALEVPITPTLQGAVGKSDEEVATEQAEQPLETQQETPEYEPPFPDRVDLFKVPRREGRGIATTPEGIEKAVELLGFVNVESPQVLLSIDGIVTPLEEGSRFADIEVISIQPPAVVLQRGRQRWRAALEN